MPAIHEKDAVAFEKEVCELLRLRGYSVSRNELIAGTQIDLVAKRLDAFDNLCFAVECTTRSQPVGVDLLKQKASVLLALNDPRYLFRLLFVSRAGFTAEAKAFAASQANLLLMTLTDLEQQLFDVSPYVEWYISNYEKSAGIFSEGNLFGQYVELAARRGLNGQPESAHELTLNWLNGHDSNLLVILGDYGSGKTSFCRELVYRLVVAKYRDHADQGFFPLLLNLREYRRALSIKQVITDALVNHYGIRLPSFLAFERLCSARSVLLVLDGFDEMTDRSDSVALVDAFAQIHVLANLDAKLLLTCRSNVFRRHADLIELLKRFSLEVHLQSENGERVSQIPLHHQALVIEIAPLNDDQQDLFIRQRFPERVDEIVAMIKRVHDLTDLSSRPVLLDMILTTLPALAGQQRPINSAALYEEYTNRWTIRDEWRLSIPLDVRQSFCNGLAWAMHTAGLTDIDWELLESIMSESLLSAGVSQNQLAQFKHDIHTCSFLVRASGSDEFRFAHKSFGEFFVGRKIAADLLAGRKSELLKAYSSRTSTAAVRDLLRQSAYQVFVTHKRSFTHSWADAVDLLPHKAEIRRFDSSDRHVTFFDSALSALDGWHPRFVAADEGRRPITSSEALDALLGRQIRELMRDQGLGGAAEELQLSEEISTFGLEYLANSGVSATDLVAGLQPDALTVMGDLLRLAKAKEYVRTNEDFLRSYVSSGPDRRFRLSCCLALIRNVETVDSRTMAGWRDALKPEAWTVALFELASRKSDDSHLLQELLDEGQLRSLDRLICSIGLQAELASKVAAQVGEALMNANDENEAMMALNFCHLVVSSHPQIFKGIRHVWDMKWSMDTKRAALDALVACGTKDAWQTARNLASLEKDAKIRTLIVEAERRIRDALSVKRRRIGWKDDAARDIVRKRMWQALRDF